jgi:hypothetical protein
MDEIHRFGEVGEYDPVLDGVFKKGEELSRFVERCCVVIKKEYPVKELDTDTFDGFTYARYCDAFAALTGALILMLSNRVFKVHAKGMRHALTKEESEASHGEIGEICASLDYIRQEWKAGRYSFFIMDYQGSETINLAMGDRYKKSYHHRTLYYGYINESRKRKTSEAWSNYLISMKDNFLQALNYVRHAYKAIFIRYALLKEFEERYRELSKDEEEITGSNEITKGEKQFVGKSLCAIFFLELAATRMKLLAYQGRSGIFTPQDRQLFQMEVSCLIQTTGDLCSRPQFRGKAILDGTYSKDPAIIDGNKEIFIDTLNPVELGMNDKTGNIIISVSTQSKCSSIVPTLDKALEKLRKQREKILGGAE